MIDLLARRRAMMAKGGVSPLPYDAQIEYLGCTSTQFVGTGIIGNQTTRLDFDFSSSDGTATRVIAGARDNNTNSISIVFRAGSNPTQRYNSKEGSYATLAGRQLLSIRPDGFYANDVKKISWNPSSFTTAWQIYLGAGSVTSTSMFIGNIYGAKIWKDNELVREMIPVRVGTTGYMYDKVSGTLFGNEGTGNFTLGNDKNT